MHIQTMLDFIIDETRALAWPVAVVVLTWLALGILVCAVAAFTPHAIAREERRGR